VTIRIHDPVQTGLSSSSAWHSLSSIKQGRMSGPAGGDTSAAPAAGNAGGFDLLRRATQAMMSRYVNELFGCIPSPLHRGVGPGRRTCTTSHWAGSASIFFCSAWFPSFYPEITCGLSVFFLSFEKPAEFSLADVLQPSDRFCTLTEPQFPRTPLPLKTSPYLFACSDAAGSAGSVGGKAHKTGQPTFDRRCSAARGGGKW